MPRGMIETFCTGSTPGNDKRDQRVTHFVMRDDLSFVRIEQAVALLQAGGDALDRLGEVGDRDGVGAAPCRQQGRLVHQIRQIGAGEAGGQRGDRLDRGAGASFIFAPWMRRISMRPFLVGTIDQHLAVEPARRAAAPDREPPAGWWRPAARCPIWYRNHRVR